MGRSVRAPAPVVALALVGGLAGCATPEPPLYGWGSYEASIYQGYARPGETSPEDQIRTLEREATEIIAAGQRLPPGWHAHLGSLYNQIGDFGKARAALLLEKAAYPESAVFVDRLLANLDGGRPAK